MQTARKLLAELLGTALLLAVVVGSGISVPGFVMAELLGAGLGAFIHRAMGTAEGQGSVRTGM
jgi:hypothetical protein